MARFLGAIGRFFIGTGLVLLLFAGFQLYGTGIQEARAQDDLASEFEQILAESELAIGEDPTPTTEAPVETTPEQPTATDSDEPPAPTTTVERSLDLDEVARWFPETGTPVAQIEIPSIGVEKVVVEGVQVDDLKNGPGHYKSTPMPGQPGNAAIAGHRTTYGAPFHNIDKLVPGDEIRVLTAQGTHTYRVIPQPVQSWTDGYCAAFEEERTKALTAGIARGANEQGLIPLNLPDDFGSAAVDGVTYFDTSAQGPDSGAQTIDPTVPGHFIVNPSDTCVLDNYGDNRLTLTACHPKYTARQRIIVQAVLVTEAAEAPPIERPLDADDLLGADEDLTGEPSEVTDGSDDSGVDGDGDGDGDDSSAAEPEEVPDDDEVALDEAEVDLDAGLGWSFEFLRPSILWGLLALGIWLITRQVAKRWRPIPTHLIGLVPLLITMFIAFENIDSFLPAY